VHISDKRKPRGRGEAPWDPHHGPVPKEHGRPTTRLSRALERISKNISPAGPGEGLPDRAGPSAMRWHRHGTVRRDRHIQESGELADS